MDNFFPIPSHSNFTFDSKSFGKWEASVCERTCVTDQMSVQLRLVILMREMLQQNEEI